jgi:hypothetical protein
MEGRELTRANYFARANVEDAEQKGILERYLLDPGRSQEELETFSGLFPNANFSVSNNLLTSTATPDSSARARQDRAALRLIEEWMADPRFGPLRPRLIEVAARLGRFVNESSAR